LPIPGDGVDRALEENVVAADIALHVEAFERLAATV
jgi:hypothetical protein